MAAYGVVSAVLVLAPWLFGAWEGWWFWPLATAIFVASACFAVALLAGRHRPDEEAVPRAVGPFLAACLPFLFYAGVRAWQTPVLLDAERSVLLVLTPLLVGVILVYGTTPGQRRRLFLVLAANLLLLGLYGIINHLLTGSRLVLWEDGYPKYWKDHRASGSYFCPDHFSGIMEIGFAVGLAVVLRARRALAPLLFGGLLLAVVTAGVVISKSRGGGLTLVAILLGGLVWGLSHRSPASRPWWRLAALCFLSAAILLVPLVAKSYTKRFLDIVGWNAARGKPPREALQIALARLERDSRPQMYAAAYRAWRTSPWVGIGPGMHETLWPHFAPSDAGDRAAGRWPKFPNYAYNSNAVHNEWLQLLEEYGVFGFALFALPAAWCVVLLRRPLAQEARREDDAQRHAPHGDGDRTLALAALLAAVAMATHAFVDFNMQMPATNWLVAALIALGLTAPSVADDDHTAARPESA